MHFADSYVGLPYLKKGETRLGLDCWGLLSLYWSEQLGFTLPKFTGVTTSRGLAKLFDQFAPGQERIHDAAVMSTEVRQGKKWVMAELHVGVVIAPRLVLHIQDGLLSRIEEMKTLNVTRILRIRG